MTRFHISKQNQHSANLGFYKAQNNISSTFRDNLTILPSRSKRILELWRRFN